MNRKVESKELAFDSILDEDEGTLTLVVHVRLLQVPPGRVRRGRVSTSWPAELWAAWPEQFREAILAAWDDKLELHAASRLVRKKPMKLGPADPGVLRCRLELRVAGVDDGYESPGHLRAEVGYYGDGKNHGGSVVSSAILGGRGKDKHRTEMWLDYRDVIGDSKGARDHDGAVVRQLGAVHEFGHHLGLEHVCVDNEKDEYCLRGPRTHALDIMGGGNDLKPWHAEPWLRRLHRHRYYPGVSWWAVVRDERTRSANAVRPGASSHAGNRGRQNAMKETAGLDASDVDALLAPTPGATPTTTRRRGLLASIRAALGLPVAA